MSDSVFILACGMMAAAVLGLAILLLDGPLLRGLPGGTVTDLLILGERLKNWWLSFKFFLGDAIGGALSWVCFVEIGSTWDRLFRRSPKVDRPYERMPVGEPRPDFAPTTNSSPDCEAPSQKRPAIQTFNILPSRDVQRLFSAGRGLVMQEAAVKSRSPVPLPEPAAQVGEPVPADVAEVDEPRVPVSPVSALDLVDVFEEAITEHFSAKYKFAKDDRAAWIKLFVDLVGRFKIYDVVTLRRMLSEFGHAAIRVERHLSRRGIGSAHRDMCEAGIYMSLIDLTLETARFLVDREKSPKTEVTREGLKRLAMLYFTDASLDKDSDTSDAIWKVVAKECRTRFKTEQEVRDMLLDSFLQPVCKFSFDTEAPVVMFRCLASYLYRTNGVELLSDPLDILQIVKQQSFRFASRRCCLGSTADLELLWRQLLAEGIRDHTALKELLYNFAPAVEAMAAEAEGFLSDTEYEDASPEVQARLFDTEHLRPVSVYVGSCLRLFMRYRSMKARNLGQFSVSSTAPVDTASLSAFVPYYVPSQCILKSCPSNPDDLKKWSAMLSKYVGKNRINDADLVRLLKAGRKNLGLPFINKSDRYEFVEACFKLSGYGPKSA